MLFSNAILKTLISDPQAVAETMCSLIKINTVCLQILKSQHSDELGSCQIIKALNSNFLFLVRFHPRHRNIENLFVNKRKLFKYWRGSVILFTFLRHLRFLLFPTIASLNLWEPDALKFSRTVNNWEQNRFCSLRLLTFRRCNNI